MCLIQTYSRNTKSKVLKDKAVVAVTPTFRNDYPQYDITSGMGFVSNVAGNIARGVKYRYVTQKAVADIHFERLIAYHKARLSETETRHN